MKLEGHCLDQSNIRGDLPKVHMPTNGPKQSAVAGVDTDRDALHAGENL